MALVIWSQKRIMQCHRHETRKVPHRMEHVNDTVAAATSGREGYAGPPQRVAAWNGSIGCMLCIMVRPPAWMTLRCAWLCAVTLATATGCSPAPLRASFDSPSPTERAYAIERAAREHDLEAVPRIIEQLHSEDPAVRMVAITALERLTGETHGYVHFAPRYKRDEAIDRWIEAYRRSQIEDERSAAGDQRPERDARTAAQSGGADE